jgi:hypothetical protein
VALNSHGTPTAAFVKNGNWENPAELSNAWLKLRKPWVWTVWARSMPTPWPIN